MQVTIKHPETSGSDAVWFDIHPERGIRLSAHAEKRAGVALTPEDLQTLKKAVDYLIANPDATLKGMCRALHPEDYSLESIEVKGV